jgi:hypothetical protein
MPLPVDDKYIQQPINQQQTETAQTEAVSGLPETV